MAAVTHERRRNSGPLFYGGYSFELLPGRKFGNPFSFRCFSYSDF
jgi:hypothetical protein